MTTATSTTNHRDHGRHALADFGELSRAAINEALSDFDPVELWGDLTETLTPRWR